MKWAFRVSLAIAACLIGIASQRFVDRLMPTSQVAFESGPNQTNDFRNDRALRDYRFSVVISMDTGRNVYLGKKRIGSPDDVALITAISEKQYADCDIRLNTEQPNDLEQPVLSETCPRVAYIKVAVETSPADVRKLAEAVKAAGSELIVVIVDKKKRFVPARRLIPLFARC